MRIGIRGRGADTMMQATIADQGPLIYVALSGIVQLDPIDHTQRTKVMPAATIIMIYCVQAATGTDFAAIQGLAGLGDLQPVPGWSTIERIADAVKNIDVVRSDPDNLYITTNLSSGQMNAIWPGPGQHVDIQSTQSSPVGRVVDFDYSQNISLWDYDSSSDDDLLGSVTAFASEQGKGEMIKIAKSLVEGSFYYVVYKVD